MSAGDRDALAIEQCRCGFTNKIEYDGHGIGLVVIRDKPRPKVHYNSLTHAQHRAHIADVIASSQWLAGQRADAWDDGHDGCCHCVCPWEEGNPCAGCSNPYRTADA